jgi:hypothetical protein
MKHRLLGFIALAALSCAVIAAGASGGGKGQLFQFRGELLATGTNSVQVQIEGGNHAALKALIGQSQDETFTTDSKTEFLGWTAGVPHVISIGDLKAGDSVQVSIRAKNGSSLADLVAKPAALVGDHGNNSGGNGRALFLYVGTVAGGQAGGHIALHVTGGNWRGLRSMLGQSLDQTFTYGDGTIFLLWQGKVPTVIGAADLKAGDRITVRIRAPRLSSLSTIENTAARHVGEHEPANAPDKA